MHLVVCLRVILGARAIISSSRIRQPREASFVSSSENAAQSQSCAPAVVRALVRECECGHGRALVCVGARLLIIENVIP